MSASQTLVDWELARKIAHSVADRRPVPDSYDRDAMARDFEGYTTLAEELVAEETGLRSAAGAARGKVTDRAGWVDANIRSFQRLLQPLADRILEKAEQKSQLNGSGSGSVSNGSAGPDSADQAKPGRASRLATSVMQKVAAAEVGLMLGWMSTRVLGQYDLLVVESESTHGPQDADMVYYVGPNIAALEWRHGFPPEQFRMWIALHELTHRAQFTGVPWMKQYFLSLVNDTMVETDPKQIMEALRQAAQARKQGKNPLAEGGLPGLLASPEQRQVLDKIMGLMSLLEGHGDVTMDRAGADRLDEIPRFREVINHRRAQLKGVSKLISQLLGMEAKLNQYIAGERFIAAVEQSHGSQSLDRAWQGPEYLPTLEEIHQPEKWTARTQTDLTPEPSPSSS